jgi:hypothetical protein
LHRFTDPLFFPNLPFNVPIAFSFHIKLAWLEIAGVSGTVLTLVGVTRKIQSVSTKASDGP